MIWNSRCAGSCALRQDNWRNEILAAIINPSTQVILCGLHSMASHRTSHGDVSLHHRVCDLPFSLLAAGSTTSDSGLLGFGVRVARATGLAQTSWPTVQTCTLVIFWKGGCCCCAMSIGHADLPEDSIDSRFSLTALVYNNRH